MLNVSSSSKADFSIQDQFNSDLPLSPKQPKLNLSDDEEPPKDFSFFDARQQVQIDDEHMKQHLAKYVYYYAVIVTLHTYNQVIICTTPFNSNHP